MTLNFSGGLSPLARGTHQIWIGAIATQRFIPAGAGNTVVVISCTDIASVYPRWRGEHSSSKAMCVPFFGLSPLARGTQPVARYRCSSCRFIPAGAGNTPAAQPQGRIFSVYPRWRGEHIALVTQRLENAGLSPLARGTRIYCRPQNMSGRFIPAGAGNTRRPPTPE